MAAFLTKPQTALFLATQRSLLPCMILTAIASSLHDGLEVFGTFTLEEQFERSNDWELLACLYTFTAFSKFMTNLRFDRRMDNADAVQALDGILPVHPNLIYGGSSAQSIQSIVLQIEGLCIQHNIDYHTFQVP